ncbi:MAG: hypothetical protein IJK55_01255 [Bacteroidales bacterium]|nr:hypothetical protein [Bacteroidales bacterium]
MKSARIPLLVLLLASLLLAGCKKASYKDIAITSARIVSIVPEGLTGVSALLEVEVHNPAGALELTGLEGLARYRGQEALTMTAEPVSVAARSDQTIRIPIQGRLADGFNPFQLLGMVSSGFNYDDVTLSLSGRASLRSGLGKNFELVDIPLGTLLNKPSLDANEE